REMTVKEGQKCTAIRRTIVPEGRQDAVIAALQTRLGGVKIVDPSVEGVKMGPLAGRAQVGEVRKAAEQLMQASEVVFGSLDQVDLVGADADKGAFFPLMLLHCADPLGRSEPHDV